MVGNAGHIVETVRLYKHNLQLGRGIADAHNAVGVRLGEMWKR